MSRNEKLIELLTTAVKAWYEDFKRTAGKNCYLSYNDGDKLIGITRLSNVQGWSELLGPGDGLRNCRACIGLNARYSYVDDAEEWTETLCKTIDRLKRYLDDHDIDLDGYELTELTEKRASEYVEENWGDDTPEQEHTKQRLDDLREEFLEQAREIVWNICDVDRFDRNKERLQNRIDEIDDDLSELDEDSTQAEITSVLRKYKKSFLSEIEALKEHLSKVLEDEYSVGRGSYDNDYTLFDGDNRPADFTEKEKEDCSEMVAGWLFDGFPAEYLNEYLEDDELTVDDFDY